MEDRFLESGQWRRGKKVICPICNREFLARLNGGKHCCSRACSSKSRIKRSEVRCSKCGKVFQITESHLRVVRHGHYFCSRECKDTAQRLDGNCPSIQPSHYGSKKAYRNSLTESLFEQGCVDCGEKRKYRLVIHHKDGNRSHNATVNLEVVCFTDHGRRHLKFTNGEWVYNPKFLTPREYLSEV